MVREATAMTVRRRLGELLIEVPHRRGKTVITRAGKPVAALVDIGTFERLRKSDEGLDRPCGELSHAFEDRAEDAVRAMVDEAVEAARSAAA